MQPFDRIGPYTLLRQLGSGARSSTWLARAAAGGVEGETEVALKLAPAHDVAACARLRHEAAIGAGLRHPQLLRIFGAGQAGGMAWLAMEALAPLPAAPGPNQFRQLLLGLAHLHQRGVIHCDVKPANLLQDAGGGVKLADFGIARLAGQGPGPAHGTPHSMSPEQLRGQALSPRSDVFAAGVLLFQVLAGERPFSGTPFQVMQQILINTPKFPPEYSAEPASDCVAVMRRAMASTPAERYADAGEFLIAFDLACQPHFHR